MQPTPSMPFTSRYDRAPKSDARLEEGPRKLAHALAELDAVAWRDNPHVQRLVAYLDQAHIPRDTAVRVLPNIVVTRDGLRFYDAEAETHGIVTDAVTRTVTCALIDPPSPSHAKVVLCLRQAAREARSGRLISLDPSHLSRDKIEQALAALPERLEVVPTRSPSAQRWDRVRDELSGLPYALCLAPLAPIVTPVACALAIAIADD